MIQFEMKRFLSVARWDMTINKKFYLSQVAGLLVLAVAPVVFQYLLWWSSGSISIFDFSGNYGDVNVPLIKNSLDMGLYYAIVSNFISIIYLGYIFHNLVHKQGRIAELTLPASNVERFLWHALFYLVAPLLVFGCCVLCADAVNLLFALLFGCLPLVSSLTYAWFDALAKGFVSFGSLDYSCWMVAFMILSSLCYMSTFALGNAIKYRYNIILTWLAHMLFWIVLSFGAMFVFGLLLQVCGRECFSHMVIDINVNQPIWFALGCLIMLILLVGIWALTYRLYCRAQITTRRNR